MQEFSIKTQLTVKEYSKVMFLGLYKKPSFILTTIGGLLLLVIVILDKFRLVSWYAETPYFEIFAGLFLVSVPTLIVLVARGQFVSNPSFQHEIKYTFGENGMAVEGRTFKGEFLWSHIIRQKEIGNFLILYHSKKMGNFIDKKLLTADQLRFIKEQVARK